jgi:glycosyltransferase involved in cell wall biosynthesis
VRMSRPLRIAQLAPAAMPVRPHEGDSIEQLVSLLTEELVRRGHDVTLFATGDSETSAKLRALYPHGYEHEPDLWDWRFHDTMHAGWALEHAGGFDVVHSHAYHFALPFVPFVSTPVVHTYHVLPAPEVSAAFARQPDAPLVAVSEFQRGCFVGIDRIAVIGHGVDTGAFPVRTAPGGDYLLFLGRMIPDKGPREAIRIASMTGMRLVLAGPGSDYFDVEIAPLVDGSAVEYAGAVPVQERNELLAGAAALLYPIAYPEPFGLVLVEAMACGTPVAAVGIGAVPEIVEEGLTGCYAESTASLVELVPSVLELDRARIRRTAVERFDHLRMVDEYERLYRQVIAGREIEAA